MSRKIIAYKHYYEAFFNSLQDEGAKEKVLYGMLMLKTFNRLPAKYVKPIEDGVFELRIEWNGNIYRIFFCFDCGNIVVLFNGFQKKTQKTPRSVIEKAKKLKKQYFDEKE